MIILNKDNRALWAAALMALALALVIMLLSYGMAGAVTTVLINTVAGTEPTDPLLATLDTPGGIALDSSGNLYIADTENSIIRMVNTSGVINTVAGNGANDYTGDGGPASSASLYRPEDVSVDASGNLYIADTQNNVIRKVNTSGIINTLAGTGTFGFSGDGGAATGARVSFPEGVLADSAGNIYIADTFNAVVRMINSSGIIDTIAGQGGTPGYSGDGGAATDALLNWPRGLAIDSSGGLYISDDYNESVRVVNSSGIINRVAGQHDTYGYSGDNGPATSALLNSPMGIAIDALDNFYIADSFNSAIRNVVSATEDIYTMAGTGDFGWRIAERARGRGLQQCNRRPLHFGH